MASAWDIAGEIRRGLHAARQPDKAEGMRAYLKSALPCLGVTADDRRKAVRAAYRHHDDMDRVVWRAVVQELWDDPEYREERHAAVDVLCAPPAQSFRDEKALDLCRDLVVEGRWWDLVDGTAWAVNDILDRHRRQVTPVIREWMDADDIWLRRVAIISQLRSKDDTDVELLRDAILASAGSDEFFLRKAIGWALRSYARTDPEWVRAFVDEHDDELSALSKREATKHL